MTKYYDLAKDNKEIAIKKAAHVIKTGGLVLFPTETVYGIGADGLNEKAVKKIFIAKGRAQDNPLILHVSDKNMIEKIARNITNMEKNIIDKFMPGPLTIILKKKKNCSRYSIGWACYSWHTYARRRNRKKFN